MNKVIIYQLIPRLFGNTNTSCIPNSSIDINGCGKLDDITTDVLLKIKELGCSHIWFTGVIEHATQTDYSNYGIKANNKSIVKGIAGSPYAITDYYDIVPALANDIEKRVTEFKDLIKRCHNIDIKVIIDFVPNHVSRDYCSDAKPNGIKDFGQDDDSTIQFKPSNNFYYITNKEFISPDHINSNEWSYKEFPAKVTGNDCLSNSPSIYDWYETVKLNYGIDIFNNNQRYFNPIPDTWLKMNDICKFWISMGVDGFRCDMAEMVPIEFWNWLICDIKKSNPKEIIFIAEIYKKELYRDYLYNGKFDLLYDKVGLYDTLKEIVINESGAHLITQQWQSIGDIEDRMLNFLENHDEVRVASDFFAKNPIKALPALITAIMLNKAPYMLYFGQELGERGMDCEGYSKVDGRTSIFDYWSVKTVREWITSEYKETQIRELYRKILNIASSHESIVKGGKFDLQYVNPFSTDYDNSRLYTFARKYNNEMILIVVNFSNLSFDIKLNIPYHLFEYFNIAPNKIYKTLDLIEQIEDEVFLSTNNKIELTIGEFGYKIIKFSL